MPDSGRSHRGHHDPQPPFHHLVTCVLAHSISDVHSSPNIHVRHLPDPEPRKPFAEPSQCTPIWLRVENVDVRDTQVRPEPLDEPFRYLHGCRQSRVDYSPRCVADKYTWTIPLNTDGVNPSTTPAYLIKHATFRICPVVHTDFMSMQNPGTLPPSIGCYNMLAKLASARCLKYQYVTRPMYAQ